MKNKSLKKIILSSLTTPIVMGLFGLGYSVFDSVSALNINETSAFTYTDANGNSYDCYHIEGEPNKIAISWAKEPEDTPNSLSVPQTITNSGTTYTVSAIEKAGFRYCDFVTITLPNTIEQIGEEAFAYCENLTTFTLPYLVSEIAPSTFLDCRNMLTFLYYDENGSVVVANNSVTSIGDHAFDSCVSLTAFECPNPLTMIGESAFQRCYSLSRIFLPSKKVVDGVTNYITIKAYAFADCENLVWVYFEDNLQTVEDYAFADCNLDMKFHYAYDGAARPDPTFSTHWRKKYLSTSKSDVYPIDNTTHVVIYQTDNYPGLRYTIQSSAIYLDSQTTSPKTIKLDDGGEDYAVIYQWTPPVTTMPNYYNVDTGALTIPGQLTFNGKNYPLKIIEAETFRGKTEIKSVKFENGIVQICNRAFYLCTEISSLDFSECSTLKEIGNSIFSDVENPTVQMTKVTSITIPNTVEYIGKYAFFNFVNVSSLSFKTDPNQPSHIKVFGGYAFGNIGKNHKAAVFDVELPCSLSDAVAREAKINIASKSDPRIKTNTDDYNNINWAAVGPYAFGGLTGNSLNDSADKTAVRVVTMETPTAAQLADNTYTCSIAPNAFNRSWYMTKFVANENFCLIGCDAFKNCSALREVFLTTRKAQAYVSRTGYQYPWGAKKETDVTKAGKDPENAIISGAERQNLVIYVDGPAPGKIEDMSIDKGVNKWNAEYANTQPFANNLSYHNKAEEGMSRFEVPTFYNVDFDETLYYSPALNAQTPGHFLDNANTPKYASDYDAGIIVFAKNKETSKYSLTKYYCNKSQNNNSYRQEIDLTSLTYNSINVSANLVEIGNSAFSADDTSVIPGLYFILPNSITEIGERAFYRKDGSGAKTRGVRIITYKSGNNIVAPSGTTYAARKNSNPGYCMLPPNISTVKLDAFYNNYFASIELPSSITHLGAGAFYTHTDSLSSSNVNSRIATVSFATNSNYQTINNGIYYVGDANKKTLIYQAQYDSATSLTIAGGTKAIGFMGCANTSYTSITLNSELTHIYGSGLQRNLKLTTVNIPSNSQLKYIGARAPGDEIWDSSLPYDSSLPLSIVDYRGWMNAGYRTNLSRTGAFRDCTALTTLNFKNLTSLVKIGSVAFRGCKLLENCSDGSSYSYYTYTGGTSVSLKETKTSGVLDLSNCTNLRAIHKGAFVDCNNIKYVELPATNGELYIGQNKEGTSSDLAFTNDGTFVNKTNNVTILFNDTATNACYYSTAPTSKAKNHIASGVLGTLSTGTNNHNTVYYYMSSASDIVGTGGNNESVNYWTKKNGKYILMIGPAAAMSYWQNEANINI